MSKSLQDADWRKMLQRLLKTEMTRRGARYQDLSERLAEIGVVQSADNLRNKVNRGIMGADLLLQIIYVLNISKLERNDIISVFEAMGIDAES